VSNQLLLGEHGHDGMLGRTAAALGAVSAPASLLKSMPLQNGRIQVQHLFEVGIGKAKAEAITLFGKMLDLPGPDSAEVSRQRHRRNDLSDTQNGRHHSVIAKALYMRETISSR
jgi:hypothetical protein